MKKIVMGLCTACVMCSAVCRAEHIQFNFETADLQGWSIVEGAFGQIISARDTEYHTGKPFKKEGRYVLSTLDATTSPDDRFEGVVESPSVRLESGAVSFLICGGKSDAVRFALCTSRGEEILVAHGENDQQLRTVTWQVPQEHVRQPLFFRVTDRATGGWGHLVVDNIVMEGVRDPASDVLRREAAQHAAEMRLRAPLVSAIKELAQRFPDYPGTELLDEVTRTTDLHALQQKALVRCNPLLNRAPILFVARPQYPSDHHNTETLFQTGEINASKYATEGSFKLLDVVSGRVTVLYTPGTHATVRDPDLDFSGRRIVFSMRKNKEDDYHIYTSDLECRDGQWRMTPPVQLTAAAHISDIDPIWLPGGDIVFASTREPKYCMCNRHIMCNLFRMQGDGANIYQLGKSTLFEGHPELLSDGRLIYDRWEYVDRNFGSAQGLWVANPDGTGHAIFYGNNTSQPGGQLEARPLPGTRTRVICTIAACHDRPWGGLAVIDRGLGVDGKTPVIRTFPESLRDAFASEGNFDLARSVKLKYEDPVPLDAEHFLCVRMTGKGEETGLYYLDFHGNEVLVHAETPGCFDPVLVQSRSKPPEHALRRDFVSKTGKFYVQDVMIGTHMANVTRSDVKYLRVVESPEKRTYAGGGESWYGKGRYPANGEQAPAVNWSCLENKRILGTVPVEDDGSAYFEVPANTFVYFQLLDGQKRMIQSMRSGINLQPGETQGCVGCHESRTADIPPVTPKIKAMQRGASPLDGWYGPARLFGFQEEVQPVFDRHCVRCHDYDQPAGKKLILRGDRSIPFCASYVALWQGNYLGALGAGPSDFMPAMSWGSRTSKLNVYVRKGHQQVHLTEEELDRLTTWEDINAPYYATYDSAQSGSVFGRSSLTREQLKRLAVLVGYPCTDDRGVASISLDHPEQSPCLKQLKQDSAEYAEALAIVRAGHQEMMRTPRADMPGFKPDARYQAMLDKYEQRKKEAERAYRAIQQGGRVYDRPEHPDPVTYYVPVELHGHTVLIHRSVQEIPGLVDALKLELTRQLEDVYRTFPPHALSAIRPVRIWVEWARKPQGGAEYHVSADWLREHGYLTDKEGDIEIANVRNFLAWSKKAQPCILIHELAHAYYERVLVKKSQQGLVREHYDQAKGKGLYANIQYVDGSLKRAYALTNEKEYFAELSEAYFGRNDFFPFVREELCAYDRAGYALMQQMWN